MALFDDDPSPRPQGRSRRERIGWAALGVAVVIGVGFALLPAPYVIEQPGPVYDTLALVLRDAEGVVDGTGLLDHVRRRKQREAHADHDGYPECGPADALAPGAALRARRRVVVEEGHPWFLPGDRVAVCERRGRRCSRRADTRKPQPRPFPRHAPAGRDYG